MAVADYILNEKEKNMDIEKLRKEYALIKVAYWIGLVGVIVLFILMFKSEWDKVTKDKLIVLRESFATNYYKQDDLKKAMKSKLGKDYTGDLKIDFDNYVLTMVTNDVSSFDDKKWSVYTEFVSKQKNEYINKELKKLENTVEYKSLNKDTYYAKLGIFESKITENKFKSHMEDMKKHNNLIIDLRGNIGGNISECRRMIDKFVDKGNILYQEKLANDKIKNQKDKKDREVDFKNIVILTDEATASSSEIFILGLKENLSNVKVIGTTTRGKGIGQSNIDFKDGSKLQYTSLYWNSPKGNSIHNVGIKPDIEVKGADNQDKKALEYIKEHS